eukprot:5788877-Prymnesium_polylepis.1
MAGAAGRRSTRSSREAPTSTAQRDENEPSAVLRDSEEPAEPRAKRTARPLVAPPPPARAPPRKSDEIERLATAAIICFYHPKVDRSTVQTKLEWAEFFGTTKQRFSFWEVRLVESIGPFKRGAVPVPAAPAGKVIKLITDETAEAPPRVELHGYNLAELKQTLSQRCTRPLDSVPYGKKGPWGMYREGFKWGVSEIVEGRLDKSGRKAAAVLNAIGVGISCYPMFHGAVAHLYEERS